MINTTHRFYLYGMKPRKNGEEQGDPRLLTTDTTRERALDTLQTFRSEFAEAFHFVLLMDMKRGYTWGYPTDHWEIEGR